MKKSEKIAFGLIILVNAAVMAFFLATENLSVITRTILSIICVTAVALGALATAHSWERARVFRELHISLLMVFLAVSCLQAVYRIAPEVFPQGLRYLTEDSPIAQQRVRVVEYLPYSPFAKPKPNVVVKIPGYYGPPTEFVYEWQTDRRGFKNLPELASREAVPVVAVGDSFAEGMGVYTEQHWASRLTQLGFPTYTLGVQGYAPIQMAGAFKQFGLPLRPQYIIIGYLAGVAARERYFTKPIEIEKPDALPSAMQRLVDEDQALARRIRLDIPERRQEIRRQYRYTAVALLVLGIRTLHERYSDFSPELTAGVRDIDNDPRFMPRRKLNPDSDIKIGAMQRYRGEIKTAFEWKADAQKFEATEEWQSTLKSFSEIIVAGQGIGAKTVIVMFRNRGFVYAEQATGRRLDADNTDDVEAALLAKFATSQRAAFIDTKSSFESATRDITEATPLDRYPYLKVDGHPSPLGHELIARQIAEYFRSEGHSQLK